MQAVILAGGRGTRLRPYTVTFPKPLMPIGELPILEIVLRQLKAKGFDRVQIATGHLSELVRAFCGDGSRWKMQVDYSHETEPLGTAGPVASMADRLDENFLVMNGDLLTTLDYRRAFAHHLSTGAAATICVFRRDAHIDFGVVEVDAAGNLAKYTEKPTFDFKVSMGINFFHRRVLSWMQPGERLDIPELIVKLLAAGERVACYSEECRWLDIGRADDYQAATETFAQFQDEFLPASSDAA